LRIRYHSRRFRCTWYRIRYHVHDSTTWYRPRYLATTVQLGMVSEGCDIDPNCSINNLPSIGPQTYSAPSGGTEASPVSCWLHGHSLQGRCERVIHSAYQLQHMLVRWYWTDTMSSLLRRMVLRSIPRSRIVHMVPDAVLRTTYYVVQTADGTGRWPGASGSDFATTCTFCAHGSECSTTSTICEYVEAKAIPCA
jgi:hypothetical protein